MVSKMSRTKAYKKMYRIPLFFQVGYVLIERMDTSYAIKHGQNTRDIQLCVEMWMSVYVRLCIAATRRKCASHALGQ